MTHIEPGLIAFFIIAPMLVTVCALIYIAHKYIETVETQLPNCRIVNVNKEAFSNAGLLGKVMRTCSISTILTIPKLCARRGMIDLVEVQNFPPRLRRLLTIPWNLLCVLFVALMVFRVWIYFLKP